MTKKILALAVLFTFTFFSVSQPVSFAKGMSNDDLLSDLDLEPAPRTAEKKTAKSSSGDDLLKELDEDFTAEPAVGKPADNAQKEKPGKAGGIIGIVQDLYDNAEGKLTAKQAVYYDKAYRREKVDNNRYMAEGMLELKTKVKRGPLAFNIAGWTEYGSQKDTYSERQYYLGLHRARNEVNYQERMRRYVELNEANLIYSWRDFDFTLGKKLFKMGTCPIYSPSNRINPMDLNDPMDNKEYGIWQFCADFFKGATTYTAALFPVFIPSKIPSRRSRWYTSIDSQRDMNRELLDSTIGGIKISDFQFYNKQIDEIKSAFPNYADSLQPLARIKTTFKGWDLFVATTSGVSPYPVLRKGNDDKAETDRVREYVTAENTSFGYSTTYKKFEFHGEGLFQWTYRQKDDDYFCYLVGTTYTIDDLIKKIGFEKLELTFDWANEVIMERQRYKGYEESSKDIRQGQRDIIIKAYLKYNEDLSFGYLMDRRLDDNGMMLSFGAKYKIRDGLIFKLSQELYYGPNDSFYGRWNNNNRLVSTLEYSF